MYSDCHSLSLSVKDSTKELKLLSNVMYVSKGIVTLIKYSRKRQAILGTVEENLDVSAGLSKFSAIRWAV